MAPPKCRVCHTTMTLIDEVQKRWLCKQDNEVYLAGANYWIGDTRQPPLPSPRAGKVIGGFVAGGAIGGILRIAKEESIIQKYVGEERKGEEFKKSLQCPHCQKATKQILVRVDDELNDQYAELICEECKGGILEHKGQTNPIPICGVCGMRMKLLDLEGQRWYCRRDDKVFRGKAT